MPSTDSTETDSPDDATAEDGQEAEAQPKQDTLTAGSQQTRHATGEEQATENRENDPPS